MSVVSRDVSLIFEYYQEIRDIQIYKGPEYNAYDRVLRVLYGIRDKPLHDQRSHIQTFIQTLESEGKTKGLWNDVLRSLKTFRSKTGDKTNGTRTSTAHIGKRETKRAS